MCLLMNDSLMELLVMIDVCRCVFCWLIMIVILYFGYARVDRRTFGREFIVVKFVVNLFIEVGVMWCVLMDIYLL